MEEGWRGSSKSGGKVSSEITVVFCAIGCNIWRVGTGWSGIVVVEGSEGFGVDGSSEVDWAIEGWE
jgi:hypothetical protein